MATHAQEVNGEEKERRLGTVQHSEVVDLSGKKKKMTAGPNMSIRELRG
jgi:ribosome-associated protein YbcJ (S4-like RNA binding protein)